MSEATPRTPMTDEERRVARALGTCTFPVGSWDKRFCREMAGLATLADAGLTEKQRAWLPRMAWRYRRQLPSGLAPATKPPEPAR